MLCAPGPRARVLGRRDPPLFKILQYHASHTSIHAVNARFGPESVMLTHCECQAQLPVQGQPKVIASARDRRNSRASPLLTRWPCPRRVSACRDAHRSAAQSRPKTTAFTGEPSSRVYRRAPVATSQTWRRVWGRCTPELVRDRTVRDKIPSTPHRRLHGEKEAASNGRGADRRVQRGRVRLCTPCPRPPMQLASRQSAFWGASCQSLLHVGQRVGRRPSMERERPFPPRHQPLHASMATYRESHAPNLATVTLNFA